MKRRGAVGLKVARYVNATAVIEGDAVGQGGVAGGKQLGGE